jgi:malonyl-CoA O-methyltransferase
VAKRFGARAAHYDEHALLQREAATQLAAFLKANDALPANGLVIEIGCGTGLLAELIAQDVERYLATDIAPEMLERCRLRLAGQPHASFAVKDGETATFSESPAAIVSNLAAQWFQNPVQGLQRLAMQTPTFAFAVPLAGSFPEWRQAFREMDREPGLLPLPESNAILRALTALPGRRTRFQTATHCLRYDNARAFVDSFRNIGADQPRPDYRPAPIRPVLERFAQGMDATAFVLYGLVREERK